MFCNPPRSELVSAAAAVGAGNTAAAVGIGGLGVAVGSLVGGGTAVAVGIGELTWATDATPPLPEEQATNNSVNTANTGKKNTRMFMLRF